MKKLWIGLWMALTVLALLSVTAFAAPAKGAAGPFEGVFTGTVKGDNGSKTTLTLDMADRQNVVSGEATLGKGLVVNAGGVCGKIAIPASSMIAEGEKSPKHPDELSAEATIEVNGMEITVEVEGEISADGETLDVTAKINTPWMCGRDPVITGTLTKVNS
jgi:hypothetical protein